MGIYLPSHWSFISFGFSWWWLAYLVVGVMLASAFTMLDLGTSGRSAGVWEIVRFVLISVLWLPAIVAMIIFGAASFLFSVIKNS